MMRGVYCPPATWMATRHRAECEHQTGQGKGKEAIERRVRLGCGERKEAGLQIIKPLTHHPAAKSFAQTLQHHLGHQGQDGTAHSEDLTSLNRRYLRFQAIEQRFSSYRSLLF